MTAQCSTRPLWAVLLCAGLALGACGRLGYDRAQDRFDPDTGTPRDDASESDGAHIDAADDSDAAADGGEVDAGIESLSILPPAALFEAGESARLVVEGGTPPYVWNAVDATVVGLDEGSAATLTVASRDCTVTVVDARGAIGVVHYSVGTWIVHDAYVGPTGWAYPSRVIVSASGVVHVTAAVRQANGVRAWVVLERAPGGTLEVVDTFSLDPAFVAEAADLVPYGPEGCVAVGSAGTADGESSVVRASPDCRSFTTLEVWRPDVTVSARASGVSIGPDGTLYVVGDVTSAAGTEAFVRMSTDDGATWSGGTIAMGASSRSVVATRAGRVFVVGRREADQTGLLLTSDTGLEWSELAHFEPGLPVHFHGPGRPALVESASGNLFATFMWQGDTSQVSVVERIDAATGTVDEVATLDAWPHTGGLAADLVTGALYATGRTASKTTGSAAAVWVWRPGTTEWRLLAPYQRVSGRDSEGDAVAIGPDGSVWAAGFGWGAGGLAVVLRQLNPDPASD